MVKAAGVRFSDNGRIYYFNSNNIELKVGDQVITETRMGPEFGTVVSLGKLVDETKGAEPLKKVLKLADEKDKKHQAENEKKNAEAFETCKQKIKEHNLDMTLTDAKYLFDNSKLIFSFTADNRIDFRDLVKDLASIFRTRIELRQISTRDEVKKIGGYGMCGRELCCCSFLKQFDGVSIKMAKEQSLSLDASKITGACGRLMCCLKYEQDVYTDILKTLPHPGALVRTEEDGEGTVESVEALRQVIRVKLKDEDGNNYFKKYKVDEVKVLKDTKKSISQEFASKEEMQELKKLEAMDKAEKKNSSGDEI
jgi:cell fate regulator YaaT (PSP1 superfamily)